MLPAQIIHFLLCLEVYLSIYKGSLLSLIAPNEWESDLNKGHIHWRLSLIAITLLPSTMPPVLLYKTEGQDNNGSGTIKERNLE